MRVKSVPRHLPRKDGISSRVKNAGAELFTDGEGNSGAKKCPALPVKTVNFANYLEMVQEMNLVAGQQSSMVPGALAKSREGSVEEVAVDVPSGAAGGSKFKDTYLYQIMTEPGLLDKIAPNKRLQPVVEVQAGPIEQQQSCPYCKRKFATEGELKGHLSVQADASKQLSCCACGKAFAQRRYLRYHQRCHSERNKFACEFCARRYSRLDNLTRHNIFHTNPNKFPCLHCERTFARKDLLKKHLKCHENKYKFHCDLCGRYFKGPVSLFNHMRSYHDVTPSEPPSSRKCRAAKN
ncbi:gastrula zinc finger protein XlCGF8.2DB-like [Copidosoma floridanum]|uniref:gastrula zinc finger protein XlCGF8.2DB-like n=1 Tax=Copidosoma floridanum TaxID=29053 RepID=UPI0006C93C80|nr:gastrula zinc finger protein XlCGF8.2DB-like [Copidosoma floridanum]